MGFAISKQVAIAVPGTIYFANVLPVAGGICVYSNDYPNFVFTHYSIPDFNYQNSFSRDAISYNNLTGICIGVDGKDVTFSARTYSGVNAIKYETPTGENKSTSSIDDDAFNCYGLVDDSIGSDSVFFIPYQGDFNETPKYYTNKISLDFSSSNTLACPSSPSYSNVRNYCGAIYNGSPRNFIVCVYDTTIGNRIWKYNADTNAFIADTAISVGTANSIVAAAVDHTNGNIYIVKYEADSTHCKVYKVRISDGAVLATSAEFNEIPTFNGLIYNADESSVFLVTNPVTTGGLDKIKINKLASAALGTTTTLEVTTGTVDNTCAVCYDPGQQIIYLAVTSGVNEYLVSVTTSTLPLTPYGLISSCADTIGSTELSWSVDEDNTSLVEVYLSDNGIDFSLYETLTGHVLSTIVSGITDETTKYWKIRRKNISDIYSPYTSIATIFCAWHPWIPEKPSWLRAVKSTDLADNIITWYYNIYDNCGNIRNYIDGFKIYRKASTDSIYTLVQTITDTAVRTWTDAAVGGIVYTYKLVSYNSHRDSGLTDAVSVDLGTPTHFYNGEFLYDGTIDYSGN